MLTVGFGIWAAPLDRLGWYRVGAWIREGSSRAIYTLRCAVRLTMDTTMWNRRHKRARRAWWWIVRCTAFGMLYWLKIRCEPCNRWQVGLARAGVDRRLG